jgi:cytochrome c553
MIYSMVATQCMMKNDGPIASPGSERELPGAIIVPRASPLECRMKPLLIIVFSLLPLFSPSIAAERPQSEAMALACSGCHGFEGHGQGSTPGIVGKAEADFARMMGDFKSGKRRSSIMNRIAAGYQDADFVALAAYFSSR